MDAILRIPVAGLHLTSMPPYSTPSTVDEFRANYQAVTERVEHVKAEQARNIDFAGGAGLSIAHLSRVLCEPQIRIFAQDKSWNLSLAKSYPINNIKKYKNIFYEKLWILDMIYQVKLIKIS